MKHVAIIVLLALVSVAVFGQTGVNPCNASATHATCAAIGGTFSGTSATMLNSWYSGSGASTYPSCGVNTTSGQYWVSYTAGSTYDFLRIGAATPAMGGSRIDDPAFEVYIMTAPGSCSGTQPTLSLVTCVNANSGTTSEYHYMTVSSGTTYYFRFFDGDGSISGGGSGGNFRYCITQYLPGDFACNALSISSLPFNYSGNTSGFTNHAESYNVGSTLYIGCSGKSWGYSFGADVFFSYVSPGSEWIRVNLSNTTPATWAELSILTAVSNNCSNTVLGNTQYASQVSGFQYECYDPPTSTFGGGFMAYGGSSGVDTALCRVIYLDAAGTYLFRMDADQSSDVTPFTIDIENYTPSNGDACTNAAPLTNNVTQSFSNENCNYTWGPDDPDPADLCAGTIENTMWMSFTSDGTGNSITVALSNISCDNADVVARAAPWRWYQYTDAWQFGIVSGSCGGPYTSDTCWSGSASTHLGNFNNPIPNTTYYLVMDGNGGAECSWDITVSGGISLLPIEGLLFDIAKDGRDVLLSWSLQHEDQVDLYEIEYSTDGINFSAIYSQPALMSMDGISAYAYTHVGVSNGIHYYRIKENTHDGQSNYSSVKVIRMDAEQEFQVQFSPIPANDYLNIQCSGTSADQIKITIFSSMGVLVYEEAYVQSSRTSQSIPIQDLAPGIYLIEVSDGVHADRQRVVIQ